MTFHSANWGVTVATNCQPETTICFGMAGVAGCETDFVSFVINKSSEISGPLINECYCTATIQDAIASNNYILTLPEMHLCRQ